MEQLINRIWDRIEDQVIDTLATVAVEVLATGAQIAISELHKHIQPKDQTVQEG